MKEFLRKNFAIVSAFLLPIVLIAFVALSAYLPSLFLSTDYNFVYTACTGNTNSYYRCNDYLRKRYAVVNNAFVVNPVDLNEDVDKDGIPDSDETYTDRIFLHDTKKNESREITLAEAQTLTLNNLLTSPDGVTISSHYNRGESGFFPFFDGGSSSYGYYLTKGKGKNKLHLINSSDRYYYQNNFQFIGWVLPGRN